MQKTKGYCVQQTFHEIAACIAALTSLALVLRGWHHHRRYRRAVAAQRMRKYVRRAPSIAKGHQLDILEGGSPGQHSGIPEELKNG